MHGEVIIAMAGVSLTDPAGMILPTPPSGLDRRPDPSHGPGQHQRKSENGDPGTRLDQPLTDQEEPQASADDEHRRSADGPFPGAHATIMPENGAAFHSDPAGGVR